MPQLPRRVPLSVGYREDVPRWVELASVPLTIVAALVSCGLFLSLYGVSPTDAYGAMFIDTVTRWSQIQSVLVRFVPLVLAALAVYVPYKAGLWNLAAEGQLYVGALTATWIALRFDASPLVLVAMMAFGSALAGALWGLIPGFFRAKWGTNEILTTLMMTFIAIQFTEYAVRSPLSGDLNISASEIFPEAAQLPVIPGTRIHVGIGFALLGILAVGVLMQKTKFGTEILITGSNPAAANQAGINIFNIYVGTMLIGGIIGGIAGMAEVMGTAVRLRPDFSLDYGFTGLMIAIIGRNGVPQLVGMSLFFAIIQIGSSTLTTQFGVPVSLALVIQAVIVLFILAAQFLKHYTIEFETRTDAEEVI